MQPLGEERGGRSGSSPRVDALGTPVRRTSSFASFGASSSAGDDEREGLLTESPASAAAAVPADAPAALSGHALRTVALLALTTLFLFADQNLMAPNLSAIAADLGMTEAERDKKLGGDIAVAFFVLGAPVALLVGALTDSYSRRNLFVAIVFLGEGPCLATAWVRSYGALFVTRMLTGISIGGSLPLLYSLVGDLVPPSRRSAVSAGIGIAQGAGVALGQVLAGYVGQNGNWRMPFVLVACPALALALAVLLLVEEPRRGAQEAALAASSEYSEKIEWHKVRNIFRIRTNLLCFAQGIPGCVPWGVMNTFFADYLAQDRGMGVAAATNVVVVFGAGGVVGSIAGGTGGQWLYNKAPGALAVLMALTTSLGCFPLLYVVNAKPLVAPSGWAFLAGVLTCVTGTNARAVLIGVNAPETRGTVFAIFNLMDGLGKGLGPAAVASMIATRGRIYAFNVSLCMWLLCGALLAGIAATLAQDERLLHQTLARASQAAAVKAEGRDASALELQSTRPQADAAVAL